MAKKYKKVGQVDVYEPEKKNGCIPVIWVTIVAIIILSVLLGNCSDS